MAKVVLTPIESRIFEEAGIEDETFLMSVAELQESLCAKDIQEKDVYSEIEQALIEVELFRGSTFNAAVDALGLEQIGFESTPDNDTPEEEAWLQQRQRELELKKQKLPPVLNDDETTGTVVPDTLEE